MQPVKELKSSRPAVGSIVATDRGNLLAVEKLQCLVPPLYNRYVAWGFEDLSLRVYDVNSDKTVTGMIYEMLPCGEITCATCPNDKILITGGACSVVHVWEFGMFLLVFLSLYEIYAEFPQLFHAQVKCSPISSCNVKILICILCPRAFVHEKSAKL